LVGDRRRGEVIDLDYGREVTFDIDFDAKRVARSGHQGL
jgi:hypothetical protein